MFGLEGIIYAFGAAVIVAIIAFFRGRLDGAKLERAEQAASEAKARDTADEIDDAVAGRSPDENRGRLRKWGR